MVVDDHAVFAECMALALWLRGLETTQVVSAPITLHQVLGEAQQFAPELVLLDFDLGHDSTESIDLIAPLARRDIPIVLLAADEDHPQLLGCLAAGAAGVFDKSGALDDLIELIENTALSSSSPGPVAGTARAPEQFETLTGSEKEVLAGLIDGLSARGLASERGVSVATVRSQIRSILLKLDVHSQLAAVALARRADWPPDAERSNPPLLLSTER